MHCRLQITFNWKQKKEVVKILLDSTYVNCRNVPLKMEILFHVLLILGLVPNVLPLVIDCEEVDSIDVLREANSEILYFWDCATRGRCRGKVIRYNGEKHWSCTTAMSQG